jgi:hypothetical protein
MNIVPYEHHYDFEKGFSHRKNEAFNRQKLLSNKAFGNVREKTDDFCVVLFFIANNLLEKK